MSISVFFQGMLAFAITIRAFINLYQYRTIYYIRCFWSPMMVRLQQKNLQISVLGDNHQACKLHTPAPKFLTMESANFVQKINFGKLK